MPAVCAGSKCAIYGRQRLQVETDNDRVRGVHYFVNLQIAGDAHGRVSLLAFNAMGFPRVGDHRHAARWLASSGSGRPPVHPW
jgi:hypothetical protein